MEAGPRESDGRTDGVPASRREADALPPTVPPLRDADEESLGGAGDGEPGEPGEEYAELRPERRLRLTQVVPVALLALLGSLMFAFPLAFAFDEAGAVVAMLGLLLGCCAAGWGMMAARRVGYTWPGLPPRGSGRRPDWRLLVLYAAGLGILAALAVWRVAALR
ncbi:hypothetical protein [Streptomyces sp. 7-21]|uniref:hypothetical protein n=1 Tax=Streptomyces sp. 7-21 TaxID=2802283 RepID=UPI00191EE4F9|nr:hypothetical protein [Streptomyces sp. 7-21]MBL1067126.1 hypothetical protein [Streptomyces sp. 7-21]